MYFTSYVYCTVSVPHSEHYVYFVLQYVLRFVMHCHLLGVDICLLYVSETIWFRTSLAWVFDQTQHIVNLRGLARVNVLTT